MAGWPQLSGSLSLSSPLRWVMGSRKESGTSSWRHPHIRCRLRVDEFECTGISQQIKQHRREGICKDFFQTINTDNVNLLQWSTWQETNALDADLISSSGAQQWWRGRSFPGSSCIGSSRRPARPAGSSWPWWSWASPGRTGVRVAALLRAQLPGSLSSNGNTPRTVSVRRKSAHAHTIYLHFRR